LLGRLLDKVAAPVADLAIECNLAASTHIESTRVVLFVCRYLPELNALWAEGVHRAERVSRVSLAPSAYHVGALLCLGQGPFVLSITVLCGRRARLMDAVGLDVRGVDFKRGVVSVRVGNRFEDRGTPLRNRLLKT
jgi:hypothetical protein